MTARDDIEAVAGGVLVDLFRAASPIKHEPLATKVAQEWAEKAAAVLAEALAPVVAEVRAEALREALGCHPDTRENDGTPCASGLHSPALWGTDGCTWVAEVAECLGELS